MNDRDRGAVGTLIDTDALLAKMREAGLVEDSAKEFTALLLVSLRDGGYGVVTTEGVGHESRDGAVPVWVLVAPFYADTVQVPLADVLLCATGDKVDLADHIRVFGSRLESNFRLWFGVAAR